jgi:hypothetical protein
MEGWMKVHPKTGVVKLECCSFAGNATPQSLVGQVLIIVWFDGDMDHFSCEVELVGNALLELAEYYKHLHGGSGKLKARIYQTHSAHTIEY